MFEHACALTDFAAVVRKMHAPISRLTNNLPIALGFGFDPFQIATAVLPGNLMKRQLGNKKNKIEAIVGGVAAGLGLIGVIIMAVLLIRFKRRNKKMTITVVPNTTRVGTPTLKPEFLQQLQEQQHQTISQSQGDGP